jgi:hypothetical protein
MANFFDQFDAPAAPNYFDQFDVKLAPAPVAKPELSWSEVPGLALQNVGSSAKKFATGLGEAVMHPIDTAGSLLNIGAGTLQNALPSVVVDFINKVDANNPAATQSAQRAVNAANAVGGELANKYGTMERIKRTAADDPVGFAGDMSMLFTGGAGAARLGGRAAEFAGAPNVAGAAQTGANALSTAAKYTNPVNALVAPINKAVQMAGPTVEELATLKAQNAVRDATVAEAQKLGYKLPPGSVDATAKNVMLERTAGKSKLEQQMSVHNQTVTDNIARKELGLSNTAPLTKETMQDIRAEEYKKGYEPVKAIGRVETDEQYAADLGKLKDEFTGAAKSFPEAVPDTVGKLIDTYGKTEFTSADAVTVSRNLRAEASANFRKSENALAKAQLGIANAMENQIERTLGDSALLDAFRDSRKRMAVSHTIEDALHLGAGRVDLKGLAKDLRQGDFLSGDLKKAAEFANTFPRVAQSPSSFGTAGAQSMLGANEIGTGIGGVIGYMMGGNEGAVAGAGAGRYIPTITAAGTRQFLQSNKGQKLVLPTYTQNKLISDQAVRNALLAEQAGKYKRTEIDIRTPTTGIPR